MISKHTNEDWLNYSHTLRHDEIYKKYLLAPVRLGICSHSLTFKLSVIRAGDHISFAYY